MGRRVVLFLPGDYRPVPNELARPNVEHVRRRADAARCATSATSRTSSTDFLTTPADAIDTLVGHRRPDDRRLRALGLRTAHDRRRRRQRHPAAARVELRRHVARPRRPAQHRRVPDEPRPRAQPALVGRTPTSPPTSGSWTRSTRGCAPGTIDHDAGCIRRRAARRSSRAVVDDVARRHAGQAAARGDARRHVDGHDQRLLRPAAPRRASASREHKIDQAWLIEQGKTVDDAPRRRRARVRHATTASSSTTATTSPSDATREPAARLLRGARPARRVPRRLPRLAVPARPDPLAAAVRLRRRPAQLRVPAGDRTARPIATATEADQGNLVPMEMLKRLLQAHGLHESVAFHDVRWGGEHDGRFVWVLLNSGLGRRVRVQPRPRHAAGRALATGSRRRTSRSPAARSPARACRARSRGRAPGSTATSS